MTQKTSKTRRVLISHCQPLNGNKEKYFILNVNLQTKQDKVNVNGVLKWNRLYDFCKSWYMQCPSGSPGYRFLTFSTWLLKVRWKGKGSVAVIWPRDWISMDHMPIICMRCENCPKNKSSIIKRLSEFDYRWFVNQTFICVRLAKFYCEFDYVWLSSAFERLVFDWVQLDTPGSNDLEQNLQLLKFRLIQPKKPKKPFTEGKETKLGLPFNYSLVIMLSHLHTVQ